MKVKTENLSGAALDRAVGQAKGLDLAPVEYSKKWEFGGPIIEREGINLWHEERGNWCASLESGEDFWHTDPLIAAMRCYVASKLGGEVEVPDELLWREVQV